MENINKTVSRLAVSLLFLTSLLLSGCGNNIEDQLSETKSTVRYSLDHLKQQLDSRKVVNALLIETYADALIKQKPDYKNIATLLRQNSTSKGNNYTALTKRLSAVSLKPADDKAASYAMQELELVYAAADVREYNNSLADVVNTIASLSDGKLAVINVPAKDKATAQQANALVGNPAYGSWNKGSDGRSFWEWYGMYSMFSNLTGGRTQYYDSWSSRPHYSYYGETGRNRWGSNADVSQNRDLSSRSPSRYNKPSASTKTRYATNASRGSSYSGSSKLSSASSSSSRSSSYGSSSRSSSFSSSRSSRSGK